LSPCCTSISVLLVVLLSLDEHFLLLDNWCTCIFENKIKIILHNQILTNKVLLKVLKNIRKFIITCNKHYCSVCIRADLSIFSHLFLCKWEKHRFQLKYFVYTIYTGLTLHVHTHSIRDINCCKSYKMPYTYTFLGKHNLCP